MYYDNNFSNLKNKTTLLDDINAKKGAVLYIVIPFNTCSDNIPDSFSVEYVEVYSGFKSIKFSNYTKDFYPVDIALIDKVEINFQLCSHNKEFLEQAKSDEHVYYQIKVNFRSENIITPVYCQLFIGSNEEQGKVIIGGSIQTRTPYIG